MPEPIIQNIEQFLRKSMEVAFKKVVDEIIAESCQKVRTRLLADADFVGKQIENTYQIQYDANGIRLALNTKLEEDMKSMEELRKDNAELKNKLAMYRNKFE